MELRKKEYTTQDLIKSIEFISNFKSMVNWGTNPAIYINTKEGPYKLDTIIMINNEIYLSSQEMENESLSD